MVDMAAISGAIASLRLAGDMAKTLVEMRDDQKIQATVIELQRKIFAAQGDALSAQADQFALLEQIADLKKDLKRFEDWETEKQRYELAKVSYVGSTAYVIKPTMRGSEPPHCICAACYSRAVKGILQPTEQQHARRRTWQCPECKTNVVVDVPLPGYAE